MSFIPIPEGTNEIRMSDGTWIPVPEGMTEVDESQLWKETEDADISINEPEPTESQTGSGVQIEDITVYSEPPKEETKFPEVYSIDNEVADIKEITTGEIEDLESQKNEALESGDRTRFHLISRNIVAKKKESAEQIAELEDRIDWTTRAKKFFTEDAPEVTGAALAGGLGRPMVGMIDILSEGLQFVDEKEYARAQSFIDKMREQNEELAGKAPITAAIMQEAVAIFGPMKFMKGAGLFKRVAGESVAGGVAEYGESKDATDALLVAAFNIPVGFGAEKVFNAPLSPSAYKAIGTKSQAELESIKGMIEFANDRGINLTNVFLNKDPKALIRMLKDGDAPEAMLDAATGLQTDVGKEMLDAFTEILMKTNIDKLDDVSLSKLGARIQESSNELHGELTSVRNKAYAKLKESPVHNAEVPMEDIHISGLKVLEEADAGTGLINAYKRIVFKNKKLLSEGDSELLKSIERKERALGEMEVKLDAFVQANASRTAIKAQEKKIAEANDILGLLYEKIDMDDIKTADMKNITEMIQDLNEIKYSGSIQVSKSGKEGFAIDRLTRNLWGTIEAKSPEYYKMAREAADKHIDIVKLFGPTGKTGTKHFPELQTIRKSEKPEIMAKTIFETVKTGGHKVESLFTILGTRDKELQKLTVGRYLNDVFGSLPKVATKEGTTRTTVANIDNLSNGLSAIFDTPDGLNLAKKILDKNTFDSLEQLHQFTKGTKDILRALDIPEQDAAGLLRTTPILGSLVKAYDNFMYKTRNLLIVGDELHATQASKNALTLVNKRLKKFQQSKKTPKDVSSFTKFLNSVKPTKKGGAILISGAGLSATTTEAKADTYYGKDDKVWGEHYQGQSDTAKMEKFRKSVKDYKGKPEYRKIEKYVKNVYPIFSGDLQNIGISKDEAIELMSNIGVHESEGGRYNRQLTSSTDPKTGKKTTKADGKGRGFWMVEVETAKDLLKNSRAYFGPKFKKTIGDPNKLEAMSDTQLGRWLQVPKNSAAFGFVKIISSIKEKEAHIRDF